MTHGKLCDSPARRWRRCQNAGHVDALRAAMTYVVEGRVTHKRNNALKLDFVDGPGAPFASAVQGAGDGAGAKLGILLGFKNGGPGSHLLTYTDGSTVAVESHEAEPSEFTRAGVPLVTVNRGDTSTACLAGGAPVMHFADDPDSAATSDLFRVMLTTAHGEDLGRLDVIRRAGGWTLARTAGAVVDELAWFGQPGRPLKVPLLGVQLALVRAPTALERDVLLGACVDIAIGLRPYTAAMA